MYTHTHTYSTVPTYHDDVAHGLPFWSWSWRKARDAKAARIRPRRMHPVVAPAHLATQGRCCQSLYPYTYTHARRACSFVCLLFVRARERVVRVLFRVASRGGLLFSVPRWRTRFTVQCLAQRGCATGTFAYIYVLVQGCTRPCREGLDVVYIACGLCVPAVAVIKHQGKGNEWRGRGRVCTHLVSLRQKKKE